MAAALFACALAAGSGVEGFAGETAGPKASTHRGVASASLLRKGGGEGATVRLDIAEGWHVMSDQPGSDYLVPLNVAGDCVLKVVYPAPEPYRVEALDRDINVLTGVQEIGLTLRPEEKVAVTVTLQVCSEDVCLPPQQLTLAD